MSNVASSAKWLITSSTSLRDQAARSARTPSSRLVPWPSALGFGVRP